MATGGVLGNGVKVAYSATSPTTYTRIQQIKSIDKFFMLTRPPVDTTVHSTSIVKTAISGMADVPQIELTLLADNDQSTSPTHEVLRVGQLASTVFYFRFEVPVIADQSKFRGLELQASVMIYDRSNLPIDGAQTTKVTLLYFGNYIEFNAGASIITG